MREFVSKLDVTSLLALLVLATIGVVAELHTLDASANTLTTTIAGGIIGFMARRPTTGTTTVTAGDPPTVETKP